MNTTSGSPEAVNENFETKKQALEAAIVVSKNLSKILQETITNKEYNGNSKKFAQAYVDQLKIIELLLDSDKNLLEYFKELFKKSKYYSDYPKDTRNNRSPFEMLASIIED